MTSMRVLLVDNDPERAAMLEAALGRSGCTVIGRVDTAADLLQRVRASQPDVIVIDRDSPDRDTLEHICMVTRDAPRPIVLFTQEKDQARMRAALQAGVSAYVVDGLSAERVRAVVDVAMTRFEAHQALKQELSEARTSLAERKQIECAKGIVMQQSRCNEDEAYNRLRKLAMERNRRLAEVARDVIEMAKLLA